VVIGLAGAATIARAQAGGLVTVDASVPPSPPTPLPFAAGGTSPAGHVLAVNSRYFTLDGKPWLPVMGEFHFSRYPADEWEREILKMKAGGVDIVSAYVFWIHHEETEGQFDWTGQRDLRRFVQLCAQHGMYVWLRIGPWDHGEVRNGGFPDWVLDGPTRQNDPNYLARVQKFYGQIGQQVKGLYWQDGGPIVGVQIENEYHPGTGPGKGAVHLEQLLQLARAAGIVAPFYTATGWDNAVVPTTDFLPVFGGYTEQFWSRKLTDLPPNQNFFFTSIRAEDNVMGDLQPKNPGYNRKYTSYPFLTAEMGGGMAIAYHRRPVMTPDDSAAAALIKMGAGANLLGYYMYHGGTNPDGQTSLQETQAAWNGYNDMEAKSYDFQAPLGEFGQVHEVYRNLKNLHLFLNDYGALLAPMGAYFAAPAPTGLADTTTPRVAVRANGSHAFIFLNNYQRNHPLAEHPDFQVELRLPGGVVEIPRAPTDVPSGVYTFWPVNFDVGGVTLQYATAEPLCKIADPATVVFFTWPGMKAEFSFAVGPDDHVEAVHGQLEQDAGVARVTGLDPGTGVAMRVQHANGPETLVLLLTRAQAQNLWKAKLAGQERLFLSPAGVFFDGEAVHLSARDPADLRVGVYPGLSGNVTGLSAAGTDGVFQEFTAHVPETKLALDVRQTQTAAPAAPVVLGSHGVAQEPGDSAFDHAAVWSIHVPASVLDGPNRAYLQINYTGDVARVYAGNRFVDDNFYKGEPFELGLWRFTSAELQNGIDLKILPLRKDAPIYLPTGAWPDFGSGDQALQVNGISVVWDYEAVLQAGK
jgi:hypothetical protein